MRVLLLMPRAIYESWPVPNDFISRIYSVPAVTLPQVAAAVPPPSTVEVLDCLVERQSFADYKRRLASYDVIGMNVTASLTALNTEITVKLIKRLNPRCTVVVGGHHATFYDREWVEKGADVVVRREAEVSFRKVVEALRDGRTLEGTVWQLPRSSSSRKAPRSVLTERPS